MRLANFDADGSPHAGLVQGGEIVDLTLALGEDHDDAATLLASRDRLASRLREIGDLGFATRPLASVALLAPVARPDRIFGVGMNYESFVDEAREAGMAIPANRLWFQRPGGCVVGPAGKVWLPYRASDLDYEGELAIVIGARCRSVDLDGARAAIGGFTVANDMTLRQSAARSLVLGKSCDTHLPIGPWIVTPDEFGDPHAKTLRTWVNGELRQEAPTSMIASVYELVAEISTACALNPGDLILTGTPAGCGVFQTPPSGLRAGDVVRIEIEGIGVLENEVEDEQAEERAAFRRRA